MSKVTGSKNGSENSEVKNASTNSEIKNAGVKNLNGNSRKIDSNSFEKDTINIDVKNSSKKTRNTNIKNSIKNTSNVDNIDVEDRRKKNSNNSVKNGEAQISHPNDKNLRKNTNVTSNDLKKRANNSSLKNAKKENNDFNVQSKKEKIGNGSEKVSDFNINKKANNSNINEKTSNSNIEDKKRKSSNQEIKNSKEEINKLAKEEINKLSTDDIKGKNEQNKNARIRNHFKIETNKINNENLKNKHKVPNKIDEVEEKKNENIDEAVDINNDDEDKFDTISLKEIREAIENKVDSRQKKSIVKEVLLNIGIAIIMIIYLLIIIMGSKNIDVETLEKDMKIMTFSILAIGIFILELSYKKDNSKIAINGIEVIIYSGINLCLVFVEKLYFNNLINIITNISIVISGYYIIKSLILSIVNIRKYKKDNSDIKEIIKK